MIAIVATYAVIAAFYLRLGLHALRWLQAAVRFKAGPSSGAATTVRAAADTALDIMMLRRLLIVNPALWVGEWVFHASLFLIVLRHLRYFLEVAPFWVRWSQTPGWIAGFLLPAALLYIFAVRLLSGQEKFSSRANLLMLLNVLAIGATGLLMSTRYRVDLVAVKLFALGIVTLNPSPPPQNAIFMVHLALVLALILYIPGHVFTAPLVMLDARRRDRERQEVMHDR